MEYIQCFLLVQKTFFLQPYTAHIFKNILFRTWVTKGFNSETACNTVFGFPHTIHEGNTGKSSVFPINVLKIPTLVVGL